MIIDKTSPLLTDEERAEKEKLENIIQVIIDNPEDTGKEIVEAFQKAETRLRGIERKGKERYFEKTSPEEALEDAREIIDALELRDVEYIFQWGKLLDPQMDQGIMESYEYRAGACEPAIRAKVITQEGVIYNKSQYDDRLKELRKLIKLKVDAWFPGYLERERLAGPYVPLSIGYYVSLRDKLSSELVGMGDGGKAVWPINDKGSGRGRALAMSDEDTILFMVWLEDDNGKIETELSRLTWEERNIINAIFSIYEQAREKGIACVMTVSDIYANMPGTNGKPSKSMRELIIRTVTKLSNMKIRIDATDQLRAWGKIGDGDKIKWVRSGRYLEIRDNELDINGRTVMGWRVIAEPIHLEYAKTLGHLDSIPRRYLNIEDKDGCPIPMSGNRQMLLTYLLRSVSIIRNDIVRATESAKKYNRYHKNDQRSPGYYREISDHISFDIMNERLGAPVAKPAITDRQLQAPAKSRTEEKRDREFIELVLDYWTRCGWIPGYELVKKGNRYAGVRILYQGGAK